MIIKNLANIVTAKTVKKYLTGSTQNWHEVKGEKFATREQALDTAEIGDTMTSHLVDATTPADFKKLARRAKITSYIAGGVTILTMGAFLSTASPVVLAGYIAIGAAAACTSAITGNVGSYHQQMADKDQTAVVHRAVEEKIDGLGSPIVQEIDEKRWLLTPSEDRKNFRVNDEVSAWLWKRSVANTLPHTGERGYFWRLAPTRSESHSSHSDGSKDKKDSSRGIRFEKGGVISTDGDGPFMRSDTSWGYRSGQIEYSIHGMRNTFLNPR